MTDTTEPSEGPEAPVEPPPTFDKRLLRFVFDDEHARALVSNGPPKAVGTILLTHSQYRDLITVAQPHEIQDQGRYWRGMLLVRVPDDHDTVLDIRWLDAREI